MGKTAERMAAFAAVLAGMVREVEGMVAVEPEARVQPVTAAAWEVWEVWPVDHDSRDSEVGETAKEEVGAEEVRVEEC